MQEDPGALPLGVFLQLWCRQLPGGPGPLRLYEEQHACDTAGILAKPPAGSEAPLPQFDLVLIDEVESLLSHFRSVTGPCQQETSGLQLPGCVRRNVEEVHRHR